MDTPQVAAGRARRITVVLGSLGVGGAERVAVTLANAWARQGSEVALVSTYLGASTSAFALHPAVSVTYLSAILPATRRWLPMTLRKVFALRRLLLRIAPDVVVSFLTNVNVLSIAALAGSRIPLIVSERTDPLADVELPQILLVARFVSYPFADALVVQTAAAAQRYQRRLRALERLAVIHNPLPAELAASAQRAKPGKGGCVVALGRLTPAKDFGKLIDAFGRALRGEFNWQLHIWGDGPLRGELQQQVDALGLQRQIRLCGATDSPSTALALGQIFVLSSRYEGFPNAMLEAMALGLPCIAFDCHSGPRELADEGRAAILVESGDVARLAEALRTLALDVELQRALGEHAAIFVRRAFAEAAVVAQWDDLIEEVGEGRSKPARPHEIATSDLRRKT